MPMVKATPAGIFVPNIPRGGGGGGICGVEKEGG